MQKPVKTEDTIHHLEITATGEKNPDSQGTEVWVRALTDARGAEIPVEQFEWDEGWQTQTEVGQTQLVFTSGQPATLRWSGPARGKLRLLLGSHQWSGQVAICWDGARQVIDLYSHGSLRCVELEAENAADASGKEAAHHSHAASGGGRHDITVHVSHALSVWRLANPLCLWDSVWHYRNLTWQFAKREFLYRYKGSLLGFLWSLIVPLLLLGVYTFVFSVIFSLKWSGAHGTGRADFALRMFCALIVFNVFSECINRAPTLITGVPNYVKKVVFPLHILPVSILGAALLQALINVVILFIFELVFLRQLPPLNALYFPLVLLPLIMLVLGLSWFLASLGVFIRDSGHILVVIIQILFYLTPIFYPVEVVPKQFQWALFLNPLTVMVEGARDTLYLGGGMMWKWWIIVTLISAMMMQMGYVWFMKTKKGFADVL